MRLKLYHFCLLYVLLCSGCTIYNITVHKHIVIQGDNNKPSIQGAELEGNDIDASPENKPDIDAEIPLR